MTQNQRNGLEVKEGFSEYLKHLALVTGIISALATASYTYYIEPKLNKKIKEATSPIKEDVMFIKVLLEETTPQEQIDKAKKRMEFLKEYKPKQ